MIIPDLEDERIVAIPCSEHLFVSTTARIIDEEIVPFLTLSMTAKKIEAEITELPEDAIKVCVLEIPMELETYNYIKKFIESLKGGKPELPEDAIIVFSMGNGNVVIDFDEDFDIEWVNHFDRRLDTIKPILDKIESDKNL